MFRQELQIYWLLLTYHTWRLCGNTGATKEKIEVLDTNLPFKWRTGRRIALMDGKRGACESLSVFWWWTVLPFSDFAEDRGATWDNSPKPVVSYHVINDSFLLKKAWYVAMLRVLSIPVHPCWYLCPSETGWLTCEQAHSQSNRWGWVKSAKKPCTSCASSVLANGRIPRQKHPNVS